MVLPFHLPPSPPMSSPSSNDSNEPSLNGSDNDRLEQFAQYVRNLGRRNPFAASLVLDLAFTVLKFFDA